MAGTVNSVAGLRTKIEQLDRELAAAEATYEALDREDPSNPAVGIVEEAIWTLEKERTMAEDAIWKLAEEQTDEQIEAHIWNHEYDEEEEAMRQIEEAQEQADYELWQNEIAPDKADVRAALAAERGVPTYANDRDNAAFLELMNAAPEGPSKERARELAEFIADKAVAEQAMATRAEARRERARWQRRASQLRWNKATGGFHIWRPDATSYRPDPEITSIEPEVKVFEGVSWSLPVYTYDEAKTYTRRELLAELVEVIAPTVKAMATPAGDLLKPARVEDNDSAVVVRERMHDEEFAYTQRDQSDEDVLARWNRPGDDLDILEIIVHKQWQEYNEEILTAYRRARLAAILREYLGSDDLAKKEIVTEWAQNAGGRWYPAQKMPVSEYVMERVNERSSALSGYYSAAASIQYKAVRRNPRSSIGPTKRILSFSEVYEIARDTVDAIEGVI